MRKLYPLFLFCLLTVILQAQTPQIQLVQLATGYVSPVDIKHCDDERLFVVEQTGYIRILYKDGTKQSAPFLNIQSRVLSTGNEQGLLGLAFSPNYKQDGFFYVNYTTGSGNGSTRISRFSVLANDSTQADPNSEVILLTFTQPYTNHNGGNMMFGKDGYLYISQGDGGSGNDPDKNAQNKNVYHGKILRLNVTGQTTYTVPATNPFVGQPNVKEEIWAYGLRNPWRCSFDRLTGDMWIGDVGQDRYEEIDFQPANSSGGENYGWLCREGAHPTPPPADLTGCTGINYVDPVFEIDQTLEPSRSITGGYVYRGAQFGNLFGRYIFTDYGSGIFRSIRKVGNNYLVDSLNDLTNFRYSSFGEDNLGELYVCFRASATNTNSSLFRLIATNNCNPTAFITFDDTVSGCSPLQLTALYGDTLSYEWYKSNNVTTDSTNILNVTESGYYKVRVYKTNQPSCSTLSDSVYVQIFDTSALNHGNAQLAYCNTDSSQDISFYTQPSGGMFSGSAMNGNEFTPANATLGNNAVTYEYTNLNGCKSAINFTVQVGEATALTKDIPTTPEFYCHFDDSVSLEGFLTPIGGTYSGSLVSNNYFYPENVIIGGAQKIYYTYINNFGCESIDSFELTAYVCHSINEVDNGNYRLYPNPNNGTFNITFTNALKEDATATIYDMSGKVCHQQVLKSGIQTNIINTSFLTKGLYFLNITGTAGKRFMIE